MVLGWYFATSSGHAGLMVEVPKDLQSNGQPIFCRTPCENLRNERDHSYGQDMIEFLSLCPIPGVF